jgi:plasmid maintenance system killer protein
MGDLGSCDEAVSREFQGGGWAADGLPAKTLPGQCRTKYPANSATQAVGSGNRRAWWRTEVRGANTLALFSFWVTIVNDDQSFADPLTEKIFRGDDLTKKEAKQLGDIRIDKAQERLLILHHSAEKDLMTLHSLHYHKLHGTGRYSIDANSRVSKWRITFAWADQELTDVSLVKIEDTH